MTKTEQLKKEFIDKYVDKRLLRPDGSIVLLLYTGELIAVPKENVSIKPSRDGGGKRQI